VWRAATHKHSEFWTGTALIRGKRGMGPAVYNTVLCYHNRSIASFFLSGDPLFSLIFLCSLSVCQNFYCEKERKG
jgi:hypothetical protein